MGSSKRIGSRFPFASMCAALVFCALLSTALDASVVPILPSAILDLPTGNSNPQTTPEVTALLAINPAGAGAAPIFDVSLGKILQNGSVISGGGDRTHFTSSVQGVSGSASNEAGTANSRGILEFAENDFTRAFGAFQPNTNNDVAEDLAAFAAARVVDLWRTGATVSWDEGNGPPASVPMSGTGPGMLMASVYALESEFGSPMPARAGSPMPDAITATFTWDGGGADNNVTTAQNWVGDVVPGANSDIIWAGTTRLNVNVDIGGPALTWTYNSTAGAFIISGAAFTISNGITNNSTATQTINNAITLTLGQTWNAASGNLVFGGNIANGGFLLTIGGGFNTSASGIISGTGGLTKTGAGTLTLFGANSYTGATTVSAGVLNIQNAISLGTTAGGTTVTSGAALQLQGGITVGNEALTLDGTGLSSTGALRNISGNNSWAGAITINSTTRINSDSGTLTLDVASGNAISGTNDSLQFGGAGNVTINDAIATGSGTLTKDGTGTLTLSAANTYTGTTTVSAGILNIRNATSLGTVAGGTTVSNGATLQLQGGITVASEALNIRGTGAAGQTGALVNISGTNNYGGLLTLAGATTLSSNSGILNLTNTGTITGATFGLTLAGTGNGSVASIIGTTTGSLTKSGTGTWTLTGANTFTGATTVNGGTLNLANGTGSALGFTSGITVNTGAILLLGGSNQINNTAQIALAGGTFLRGAGFSEGSFNSPGAGALNLTAAGSHVDFGTGVVGILTFASFAPGAFTLTIDNWSGTAATQGTGLNDRLIFATNQLGNLGSFNFTGFAAGAVQFDLGNGYFEITPVPETGTYFSGSIVLALILLHHRRQLRHLLHAPRASRKLRFSKADGTGVAS
jgi:autotransporter-associated beta strand protein